MKKSSFIFILLVLVFGLVGCSGGGAGTADTSGGDTTEQPIGGSDGIDETNSSNIGGGAGDTGDTSIGTGTDSNGDTTNTDGGDTSGGTSSGGTTGGSTGGSTGGTTPAPRITIPFPTLPTDINLNHKYIPPQSQ